MVSTTIPSLSKSIATGAIGFGLVSLFVFATVAYGERRMYQNLGMLGAYLTWTVTFIVLSRNRSGAAPRATKIKT